MANILVIEDERISRKIITLAMENTAHTVFEAENGKQGIDIFNAEIIDLVITDLYMPEKEGIETIRELKVISPGVKIIVVTGGTRKAGLPLGIDEVAKDFGAAYVLYRPVDPLELIDKVEILLTY